MDAADLAWKLALVVRGRGKPILLESYAFEREKADAHALEVSDLVHGQVMAMIGENPRSAPPPDEQTELAQRRGKAILDVSYAGSPLVKDQVGTVPPIGPEPGERYPDRIWLQRISHHLLVFGPIPVDLEDFQSRWGDLVEVLNPAENGLSGARSGVPDGGLVLVRPDGYIGFRAVPADLGALEDHLASYLIARIGIETGGQ